jgi:SAM-dependent methyltransferase
MNRDPRAFDDLIADASRNAESMTGWDFSYVKGRREEDRHPWNYAQTVCAMLDGVHDMLDMDTGGGEVLLGLKECATTWPSRVVATEGYHPNVAVAAQNLGPINAEVIECGANGRLPFDDASFDLIANRHGDHRSAELFRVLRPGGVFVTQQINFADKVTIRSLLGGPEPQFDKSGFDEVVADFQRAGFAIEQQREFHGRDLFNDVGALVFVLRAAPWELPGFSVEQYRDRLYELHERIQSSGPLDLGIGFLLLVARKPF